MHSKKGTSFWGCLYILKYLCMAGKIVVEPVICEKLSVP